MTNTNHIAVSDEGDPEVHLETVAQAVESAMDVADDLPVAEVILRAAAAMPVDASNFDRGLAAGVALARLAEKSTSEPDSTG